MNNIPSKKAIASLLARRLGFGRRPDGSPVSNGAEGVALLRFVLEYWRDQRISSREMLSRADTLLDGHGIVPLRSINGRAHAYYVNLGETYEPTVLLDTALNNVRLTSWGDYVEGQERKGNRFA